MVGCKTLSRSPESFGTQEGTMSAGAPYQQGEQGLKAYNVDFPLPRQLFWPLWRRTTTWIGFLLVFFPVHMVIKPGNAADFLAQSDKEGNAHIALYMHLQVCHGVLRSVLSSGSPLYSILRTLQVHCPSDVPFFILEDISVSIRTIRTADQESSQSRRAASNHSFRRLEAVEMQAKTQKPGQFWFPICITSLH